jgi:hypothetical protein
MANNGFHQLQAQNKAMTAPRWDNNPTERARATPGLYHPNREKYAYFWEKTSGERLASFRSYAACSRRNLPEF